MGNSCDTSTGLRKRKEGKPVDAMEGAKREGSADGVFVSSDGRIGTVCGTVPTVQHQSKDGVQVEATIYPGGAGGVLTNPRLIPTWEGPQAANIFISILALLRP